MEADPISKDLKPLEDSLKEAKKAAADCILKSSWMLTIPGVMASVPLSIYMKTYAPLVFTAVTASGIDYYRGMMECKHLTDEVKKIQREIAIIKLAGKDIPMP